jgi:hypothetical protein
MPTQPSQLDGELHDAIGRARPQSEDDPLSSCDLSAMLAVRVIALTRLAEKPSGSKQNLAADLPLGD